MKQLRLSWFVLTALAGLGAAGCARQYHWYGTDTCCINYHDCPPAPLPYTTYHGCETPLAASYAFHEDSAPPPCAAP